MSAKSPTLSVKSREVIGVDAFSQRREVFDKHDTVFLPLPSPTSMVPMYREVEPIVTSNHGKTTSNFKRNTTGYSSFRETKTAEKDYDFRPRKYSDNFTSELNQSDDVDYRYSAMERNRRLSKMRKDFLASNLHDPVDQPFTRAGMRASLPAGKSTTPIRYKIESPNLYKFPFAEPYSTPPPVRRIVVDLGESETDGKENQDPEVRPKHQSLPANDLPHSPSKVDHQKIFEELVKRYSPQRLPVDWKLPPTKPRVIASVPKSTSSVTDTVDKFEKEQKINRKSDDDEVFEKKENSITNGVVEENIISEPNPLAAVVFNGPEIINENQTKIEDDNKETESKVSLSEEEKNDRVPELSIIQRQMSRESATAKKPVIEQNDLTIPALIDKMTKEGEKLENNTQNPKKVKRKRSFLDKLLGRKKDK